MLSSFGFTILLSSEQIFCMYLSHGRMHLTTFLWQIPKHWISPPDHFATNQILSSPIASVRFPSTSATCRTVVTKTCGAILPLSWQPEMSDGGESFRQQGTVVEIIIYHRMWPKCTKQPLVRFVCNITEYQAAHSFLRIMVLVEPEIIFELSSIKVCWTDMLTKQFRVSSPGRTANNNLYLQWPRH